MYDRLGVTLTTVDFRGESSYNSALAPVVAELSGLDLVRVSDGATCVFPAGFVGRDGEPLPLILRKRDGGYSYGATDLAAIRYRLLDLGATRLLYVVGTPQQPAPVDGLPDRAGGRLAVAARVGHPRRIRPGARPRRAQARDPGRRRGQAGRPARRGGGPGGRDRRRTSTRPPGTAVARAVGIGAVKYADLSSDRNRDYVFDWDRMLATTGDTAAYLQYTHARVRSIFAKAGADPGPVVARPIPAERALALELLAFPAVVGEVARTLLFHPLTGYLQRLAGAFTAFYDRCPVLKAEPAVRASRLALCDLTGRTLVRGLDLLGIATPTPM